MANIGTTSIADCLAPPSNAPWVRRYVNDTTDYYYAVARTGTDTLTLYVSTNNGSSWSTLSSFTHTGLQEWSSIVLDSSLRLHLAYRLSVSSQDSIWYKRYDLNTNTWTANKQISQLDANGGVNGSRWQSVDLVVAKFASGVSTVVIAAAWASTTNRYGAVAMVVVVNPDGLATISNSMITGNRFFEVDGTLPGHQGVSIETEHNGDGYYVTTPNLWISWGRNALYCVKLTYNASTGGWSGPATPVTIRTGMPAMDFQAGRWDGTQWLMGWRCPEDYDRVRVYQRNKANTSTSTFDTPQHPAGQVRWYALSYNNSTKDIRVFAVGTSNNTLYFVDYVRGSATWSAWSQVGPSVLANSGAEFGVRRGGTSGNNRHDIVYAVSGSPNTITHGLLLASSAPDVATFDTSGKPYVDGGPADVTQPLALSWTFTDIDPGQTQGQYMLSRQIGAGAVEYFSATTGLWQSGVVANVSSVQGRTLSAGWGTAGSAAHQYKVLVFDNAGQIAPAFSQALTLYPSSPVNPTVTAPTASQVLTTDSVTVSWTVSQQTGARIVLNQVSPVNVGVVYDSGPMMGYTDTSFTIPQRLNNSTGYTVDVYTYNNEQLSSAAANRAFSAQFAAPPAALSTFLPIPAEGVIQVTAVNATAVGAQPAVAYQDLYRRARSAVSVPLLNTNTSFEGNVTGWAIGGGGGGTLTYSTTQAHSGTGSARYVPNGAAASPQVEYSGPNIPVVAGKSYIASGWVRPDSSSKPIFVSVNWFNSGVFLGSTTVQVIAPVPGAWHYIEAYGDSSVYPTATRISIGAGLSGTPLAADAIYVDQLELREHNPDPGVRVTDGVASGGVVKDWGAASGVDYEYRWLTRGMNGTTVVGPWMS
jgi:hypothetical protein